MSSVRSVSAARYQVPSKWDVTGLFLPMHRTQTIASNPESIKTGGEKVRQPILIQAPIDRGFLIYLSQYSFIRIDMVNSTSARLSFAISF